jgi:hypothetical protein
VRTSNQSQFTTSKGLRIQSKPTTTPSVLRRAIKLPTGHLSFKAENIQPNPQNKSKPILSHRQFIKTKRLKD